MFFSLTGRCSLKTCSKSMCVFVDEGYVPAHGTSYTVQCPDCLSHIVFTLDDSVQVETVPKDAIWAKRKPLKSILVVDDEADLRDTLSTLLLLEGFAVRTCASREDALVILPQDIPDLIIADWNMPGMMLETFVQIVHEQYAILRVVLFSGAQSAPQMAESLSIPYISKSVSTDELVSAIQRILN